MTNNATMHAIRPQELRELLLPILACLPTAFLAPQPPPALYPLLSPILRQRIHLLSAGSSRNSEPPSHESWLRLLNWSSERSQRLLDIVSRLQLEPHPVSGELELFGDTSDPDAGKVWYRRLDEETIHARCDVKEYSLGFIYVWCTNDTGGVGLESAASGDAKDGWKAAEIMPLDGDENPGLEGWQENIDDVEQCTSRNTHNTGNGRRIPGTNTNHLPVNGTTDGEDDDDYWASYDRTPGKSTPSATRAMSADDISENQGQSEQEYFSRYGQVQPAMDAHDPDEEAETRELQPPNANANAGQPHDRAQDHQEGNEYTAFMSLNDAIEQPTDLAMSSGQRMVSALDDSQDQLHASEALPERSASGASTPADTSVKQHISGEIKSLFRLAQGVGIERLEFTELVQRELGVLGLIEL